MSDAINRAIDLSEEYDTMMEVQRNPCGAWMAIQEMAGIIAAIPAVQPDTREAALREALEAVNAKWRSGADTPDEMRGLALAEAAIFELIEGENHD